jgi:hypothetical protein
MPRDGDRLTTLESRIPPTFEGFPYLVTRIGHTPLRHINLLPADWPRERLLVVARRQVAANQLDTCLCLSMAEGVYLTPDGKDSSGGLIVFGMPLTGRLLLPEPLPDTEELRTRARALDAFIERVAATDGYLVGDGLEGGRRASPAEVRRLTGHDARGLPRGLSPCPDCGMPRGEFLAVQGEGNGDRTPRVVDVHCRCQNRNRCARCGGPLASGRLSAYHYDERLRRVLYLAAYAGLDHRCGE